MPICSTDRCTCPLSVNDGCTYDDVASVVAASMRDHAQENQLDGNWYATSAAALLAEGLEDWGVPARQRHRADAWRAACRAELRAYLKEAA